ncbi:hypothetical protein BDZ97DRAFT_1824698 [Flammula alnicola]|nr:hypothetical protein BDZ97DRAFT_1824698 [Flammula alnicola]
MSLTSMLADRRRKPGARMVVVMLALMGCGGGGGACWSGWRAWRWMCWSCWRGRGIRRRVWMWVVWSAATFSQHQDQHQHRLRLLHPYAFTCATPLCLRSDTRLRCPPPPRLQVYHPAPKLQLKMHPNCQRSSTPSRPAASSMSISGPHGQRRRQIALLPSKLRQTRMQTQTRTQTRTRIRTRTQP